MSDRIQILGIHGFGHHGVFATEQKKGQDFFVDVIMYVDLEKASRSDALLDTIDYGAVCDLVISQIAGPPMSLIEKLAGQIGDLLLAKFPLLRRVNVTVHKPQAPVNAEVLDIAVTIERSR
jgi:dihydroneopterin aldolase